MEQVAELKRWAFRSQHAAMARNVPDLPHRHGRYFLV
jgi:hypothetical protein